MSRIGALLVGGLLLLVGALWWMTTMPGNSVREPLPALSPPERALVPRLEADVRVLAERIGERHLLAGDSLPQAADWIEARMRELGYAPQRHRYTLRGTAAKRTAGMSADNIVAEVPGTQRPTEIVVVGAHYDTVPGSPGANDNASGVAALLALAEYFAERPQPRTLRFVAFANEEQPFFLSEDMGSYAYARHSREQGEDIVAMIALDGLGYYDDAPGSQDYPLPGLALIYPDAAEFIAFITRARDASLLRQAIGAFREAASIPSEGVALPGSLAGVERSDHWSFWQHGYAAFLVTDTLPFRDPEYHQPGDTPQRLDYRRLARVTQGLKHVAAALAAQ
jgi:hypothetical protein